MGPRSPNPFPEVARRSEGLRSVDRVEVDDREIRIVGRKDVLEQAVLATGGPIPGVRSFVRKMARPEGALSNELFRVLGDWNAYLKQEKIDAGRPSL